MKTNIFEHHKEAAGRSQTSHPKEPSLKKIKRRSVEDQKTVHEKKT